MTARHRPIALAAALLLGACAGTPPGPGAAAANPGTDPVADVDQRPAAEALPLLAQLLLNALPHDAAVWQRYVSERATYVSETGETATKAELLEGFGPFPPGLSGSLEVREPKVTEAGDAATIVFRAHERQSVFGQSIEVDYRGSQVWQREDGRWRLLLAQTVVLARDPAPQPVPARALRAYAGAYQLGPRRYEVEVRGAELHGGSPGRLVPLLAVGDNVFAESGNPLGVIRIFVRDGKGRVIRMIQRRKHADLAWDKVPSGN